MAIEKSQVEAFFKGYIAAFNVRDGAAIASMYNAPCVSVRGDGAIVSFGSQGELLSFFQKLADTYYNDGCRDWKYENLALTPVGGRSTMATMDWAMLRADGSAIRRWKQSYNLVLADSKLRILTSTFHA